MWFSQSSGYRPSRRHDQILHGPWQDHPAGITKGHGTIFQSTPDTRHTHPELLLGKPYPRFWRPRVGDDMHIRPKATVLTNAIQITNRIFTEIGNRKPNTTVRRCNERPRTSEQRRHPTPGPEPNSINPHPQNASFRKYTETIWQSQTLYVPHRSGQLAKRIHCLVRMERINPRQQMSLNKASPTGKLPWRQIDLEVTEGRYRQD